MSLITIDHNACRRDGACSAVCPVALFETDSDGFPALSAGGEERCFACGHCVAVCPNSAVHHQDLPLEDAPLIDHTLTVSAPALNQLLKSRRSVREFRDVPVPEELIREAIEAARWAPSAINRQPVSWLVIRTPSEVRKLAGLAVDYLRESPDSRYAKYIELWEQGTDAVLRNAPHLIVLHAPDEWIWSAVDGAIAVTQFEMAAVAAGIGTCWAGILMRAANGHPPLRKALGIPCDHSVYGALMMGFPRYQYHRIPPRKKAHVEWR